MKSLIKKSFVVAFAFLTTSLFAQKFGYVDSNELMLGMPERKKAEADLQAYAQQLQQQLQAMSAEFEAKVAEYQQKESSYIESVKKAKLKEITDLETRIKEFQMTAQDDLKNKEEELLKPMVEKIKKTIADFAKENKYSYIFDSAAGTLLYMPESDNLGPQIKKKLGIQ
ncbi:MAG: OmpH family outer membrane protein [Bacteroidia bacterium]